MVKTFCRQQTIVQHGECTKIHRIVHFRMVKFMVCVLSLKEGGYAQQCQMLQWNHKNHTESEWSLSLHSPSFLPQSSILSQFNTNDPDWSKQILIPFLVNTDLGGVGRLNNWWNSLWSFLAKTFVPPSTGNWTLGHCTIQLHLQPFLCSDKDWCFPGKAGLGTLRFSCLSLLTCQDYGYVPPWLAFHYSQIK